MKLIFILFCLLIAPFMTKAQFGLSLDATPNLVFANNRGSGTIPPGFFLNKTNLSFNTGISASYQLNKYFNLRLGICYFINNYYSRYSIYSDSKKIPLNRNNIQTSFFEPKLSFTFHIYSNKKPILFTELGFGVALSKSPTYTVNSEYYYTNQSGLSDTIPAITSVSPIPKSMPLKIYIAIGKNFPLFKHHVKNLSADISLSYRFSQNEEQIDRSYMEKNQTYTFRYFRNSSFLGLTFRLNYLFTSRIKMQND